MKLDLVSKRVLIIGIESFTGKHLANHLRVSGYDVLGTSFFESDDARIFQCDITNKESISKILNTVLPEYIINLAGISFVGNAKKELFYTVNVLAVENILEAILEIENYQPKKIILVSSATVYGNQESHVLDETMIPNPLNHYGISKLAMEQIAKTFFDKLNIVITRPFNYTGIGQESHFLIPKIVSHFKEHKSKIELGNIDVFREFNDVGYVSEVYKRLLESNLKSEILNICSNRVIALKEVIHQMNTLAGYEIEIIVNPIFVRQNEITSLSGSVDKLFSSVGVIEQKEFINTLKDMYESSI
jgi:nucleoside-diphosphate-sugar epimerase